MTVAKVLVVISRLPSCSGQVNDAVSAYTQVQMKGAPEPHYLPEEDCPKVWIRLPKARRPQNYDLSDDPVVLLERHLLRSSIG